MNKIIKGDDVVVLSGKDKGRRGQVLRVLGNKVVVDGVNVVKRHQRPNPARQITGGLVEKNMPLDISKVAIFNPETKKADRVGVHVVEEEGRIKRVRVFKSTGAKINA